MGPVVFPLSFCGITAGNVIHIFFINDLTLYPFTVNQHGPFGRGVLPLLSSSLGSRRGHLLTRGPNGTISMGWEGWEHPVHMHLASKVNKKVDSDVRLCEHTQPVISGRQDQQLCGLY